MLGLVQFAQQEVTVLQKTTLSSLAHLTNTKMKQDKHFARHAQMATLASLKIQPLCIVAMVISLIDSIRLAM